MAGSVPTAGISAPAPKSAPTGTCSAAAPQRGLIHQSEVLQRARKRRYPRSCAMGQKGRAVTRGGTLSSSLALQQPERGAKFAATFRE